jgi:ribosomal protein S18 acetylase RimI-like enzyme
MISENAQELNNPVWFSLSQTHLVFALEYGSVKFYHPDYCPFGGFIQIENTSAGIGEYSLLADSFYIVGEKPVLPDPFQFEKELVCLQMVSEQRIDTDKKENIVELGKESRKELFQLVNLVQPGYFKTKTALLGHYYGIFNKNRLVAVTGERMQMNNYIEVSAVVTHPDHTGKGYAKQLVAHTVNEIFNQNKIAYLHVAETNVAAIKLYEKLGFKLRRKISFWKIAR